MKNSFVAWFWFKRLKRGLFSSYKAYKNKWGMIIFSSIVLLLFFFDLHSLQYGDIQAFLAIFASGVYSNYHFFLFRYACCNPLVWSPPWSQTAELPSTCLTQLRDCSEILTHNPHNFKIITWKSSKIEKQILSKLIIERIVAYLFIIKRIRRPIW